MKHTPAAQTPLRNDEKPKFDASPAYANYVLGMLFIVYVFNFIDRQAMSVFIGPIKEEFGASDTEMGLLVGFAFALLYTIGGIPIARLADRSNRRNIIAIGLAVWSAMTVASGLAKNFTQLFIARLGVGIGEAAGTPPAHSMIADYFPINRRATALAVYSSGVFVGAAIAYLGGGWLREYFSWRTAFIILGAPGLLVAVIFALTVREPPRGLSEPGVSEPGVSKHREDSSTKTTLRETLAYLMARKSWNYLILGSSFLSISGYGVLMWGYEFYGRIHSMSPLEVGKWMALIVGLGGSLGTLMGGQLVDRLVSKSPARSVRVPALITLAALPLGIGFLMSDSQLLSLLFFFPYYIGICLYIPMMYATNQNLAQLNMRATASAILLFIINMVGAGAGPLIVGALSDFFAAEHGVHAIRYALLCTNVFVVLGGLSFMLCARHLEYDQNLEYDLQKAAVTGAPKA